jgi:hypothetical protein
MPATQCRDVTRAGGEALRDTQRRVSAGVAQPCARGLVRNCAASAPHGIRAVGPQGLRRASAALSEMRKIEQTALMFPLPPQVPVTSCAQAPEMTVAGITSKAQNRDGRRDRRQSTVL